MIGVLTIHKDLIISHHLFSSLITTTHVAVRDEQLVNSIVRQRKTKEKPKTTQISWW